MIRNSIFIERKNKVIVPSTKRYDTNSLELLTHARKVSTAIKNLESLGYLPSPELSDRLMDITTSELTRWFNGTLKTLKKMVGAHVEYKPMYPNFPTQVMEADESELYINAIMHYLGTAFGMNILPKYEKEPREKFNDKGVKFKILDLGTEEEFNKIFENLMKSKTSISATDKDHLKWYLENTEDASLPEKFNHKEIQAFVINVMIEAKKLKKISGYFRTATDVLRLAVTMSDGDESLAEKTKFRNFKRKERKLLLTLLNDCGNIEEDMLRYRMEWIRLGEKLHPGEYKKLHKMRTAFDKIRNNKPIETFAGRLEKLLEGKSKNIDEIVDMLSYRAGEFARRLDHVIRLGSTLKKRKEIVERFAYVAKDVSTPILLQLISHYKHRNDDKDLRVIFPKGMIAKAKALPNDLPNIQEEVCEEIVYACESALYNRFNELDEIGRVYIDQKLKNVLVPFSQRSASKAMKTLVRGSKFDIIDGSTIRFFIWWKNLDDGSTGWRSSVDIDLSAIMYDKDWNYLEHISYTNLRSSKYKACHSGDITDAPNGAAEFIDIDIDSVVKYGGRYVMMNVLSYSNQPFINLPECFAGWMVRSEPQSGEIFEPKTVENKVDLTADTKIGVPLVLDLVERKVIWADLALKNHPRWQNNIESNGQSIALMGKSMVEMVKPNLYDLFELHFEARGEELVDTPEEADTIFAMETGITPFDIETIMGEYL